MERAIKKDAALKGQLAKVCAEQFPPTPANVIHAPGQVDTSGLLKWYDDQIKGALTPNYDHGLTNIPSNDSAKLRIDTGPVKWAIGVSAKPFLYIPHNATRDDIIRINKDSLISALKRFIKPDTVLISTGVDSAMYAALWYQFGKSQDSLTTIKKVNVELTIMSAELKGKASTRLWIIVSLCLLIGIGIVLKLKRII